ncbi:MAG: hypothetical protein Q4F66_05355 [Clostridium sp.]|nr:hypothetical protein [Clostridium sp.]
MNIKIIKENKKVFLDLLLLADEQESMIDNYDEPIFECGRQLIDMVYLKKDLH